jgi:hypothetical protein
MDQPTALDILKTGANVFLTGEPGSGKTYLVNQYVRYLRDHAIPTAITASTGIAATHINGVTIHSWCGIGIRESLTNRDLEVITGTERLVKQIRNTQVLIIDEISMLAATTLDMVDAVCRAIRRPAEPFGGLQVVLVGDFFQLPPISRPGEREAQFAFAAPAWGESMFTVCYLTEQHRQSDVDLSAVLAAIRNGSAMSDTQALLSSRRVTAHDHIHATKLYAHNANVDEVNATKLAQLPDKVHVFEMDHHGPKAKVEQLVRGCLSPARLELKIGASVMCTRNNPEKGFVNGTLATVIDFDDSDRGPIIKTTAGRRIHVEPMEWAMEEGEKVRARIVQIPLRLAWAITIHKSQGMSLDAAVMDLSRSFAFGQGYVALSRVRTLAGLFLLGWNERALGVDPQIKDQDQALREQSSQAAEAWLALDEADRVKAQEEFIGRGGGNIHPEPSNIKPGEVVQVLPHAKRIAELRKTYPRAYTPWTKSADDQLVKLHTAEATISELAKQLERHPGGIRSRLRHLGLV